MTTIVKRGREASLEFTCPLCETVFMADPDSYEVGSEWSVWADGEKKHGPIIAFSNCPVCDLNIEIVVKRGVNVNVPAP